MRFYGFIYVFEIYYWLKHLLIAHNLSRVGAARGRAWDDTPLYQLS